MLDANADADVAVPSSLLVSGVPSLLAVRGNIDTTVPVGVELALGCAAEAEVETKADVED